MGISGDGCNAASQAEQWLPSIVQFGSGDLAMEFNDLGTDSNGDVSFRLLFNPIVGTSGDDTLSGGPGAEKIDGREGNDVISGNAGDDTLVGGAGNDTVDGGDGSDALDGGDGNDILGGGAGDDALNGGGGTDLIYGGEGNDRIDSGAGGDRSTFEQVFAEGGDDILTVSGAQNGRYVRADGGVGIDTLLITANAGSFFGSGYVGFERLQLQTAGSFSSFSGFSTMTLGTGSCTLFDSFNPNAALAVDGQFLTLRNSSVASISGSLGRNVVELWDGSVVSGNVTLGDGDDIFTLRLVEGTSFATVGGLINGGAGNDLLQISWFGAGSHSFDLAKASGFELLFLNTPSNSGPSDARLTHLNGVSQLVVGHQTSLSLGESSSSNLNVSVSGTFTLEGGTTIRRYGLQETPNFVQPTNLVEANAQLSTAFNNFGRVTSDVVFNAGNDLFDGRAGTVDGIIYGTVSTMAVLLAAPTPIQSSMLAGACSRPTFSSSDPMIGPIDGHRFIMRAIAAEVAFVEGDRVDGEVVAAQRGVGGKERVERGVGAPSTSLGTGAAPPREGDVRMVSAVFGRQADPYADPLDLGGKRGEGATRLDPGP